MITTSTQHRPSVTYDVRIWSIRAYTGKTRTSHTVQWRVGPRRHQRTFATRALADSFRADLLNQTHHGTPFNRSTGLPATVGDPAQGRSWYEHAVDYVDTTWPHVSARHRKGTAEALTTLTMALVTSTTGAPPAPEVRRALFGWAFNASAHRHDHRDIAALDWIRAASVSLACLREATWLHTALIAIGITQTGSAAAASTFRRKRATFHHALGYAVELDLLPVNPLDKIRRRPAAPATALDPRIVVNPSQARTLLKAVHVIAPALEGFFACLYYAGLRPSEARNLQRRHCTLPETGWGRLLLTGSRQVAGAAGPTPEPPTRPARSSTVPPDRPASFRRTQTSSLPCVATSIGSAPAPTGCCSSPTSPAAGNPSHRRTATRCPWAPSTGSGTWPEPQRSPTAAARMNRRWPGGPTTCAMPACRPGSTPASRPRRSPPGPATASPCCWPCTPTASTARTRPTCNASRPSCHPPRLLSRGCRNPAQPQPPTPRPDAVVNSNHDRTGDPQPTLYGVRSGSGFPNAFPTEPAPKPLEAASALTTEHRT